MKDVKDMTGEDWNRAISLWDLANQTLDKLLEEYREHREADTCAHPACTGTEMAEMFDASPDKGMAMLLHVAMNRIETMRLEKEAGL